MKPQLQLLQVTTGVAKSTRAEILEARFFFSHVTQLSPAHMNSERIILLFILTKKKKKKSPL